MKSAIEIVDVRQLAGRGEEHDAEEAVFRLRAESGAVDAQHAGRAQERRARNLRRSCRAAAETFGIA